MGYSKNEDPLETKTYYLGPENEDLFISLFNMILLWFLTGNIQLLF